MVMLRKSLYWGTRPPHLGPIPTLYKVVTWQVRFVAWIIKTSVLLYSTSLMAISLKRAVNFRSVKSKACTLQTL